ncbi:MAG: 6-phosphofructokinase [Chloroflexi bacterium]|nr:MAG: 6-phosphofructokinase [Chloroflexota bacterium]
MSKSIGILTAGGDSPGLNAAIRGIGKAAHTYHDMNVIGFRDGFRGLMENRTMPLNPSSLSGILTVGGTILGTSRDKPDRMPVGGKLMDMTEVIVANYEKHHLDALVCLGGGGTQKNAYHLMQHGLNIITLPKTIDNDVPMTDVTFGFDTALGIATEAIDRLHSTAHSHHRIIVVEIMGHRAGWLALGAGIAGGADVILIPEIPYDVNVVAEAIRRRSIAGSRFSIVAVAEGAISKEQAASLAAVYAGHAEHTAENGHNGDQPAKARKDGKQAKGDKGDKGDKEDKGEKTAKVGKETKKALKAKILELEAQQAGNTLRLAQQLEQLTGLESRLTILGHLQRGGTPSAADRLLATRLGTACAELINEGVYGVMVAARGEGTAAVPLDQVAGKLKTVPLDHQWLDCARRVGTCLGD